METICKAIYAQLLVEICELNRLNAMTAVTDYHKSLSECRATRITKLRELLAQVESMV